MKTIKHTSNKLRITNILLACIYAGLIVAMAVGTVIQRLNGADFAAEHIYGSPWFLGMWIALIILLGIDIFKKSQRNNPTTSALHCSLVFILIGATLSTYSSTKYEIQLMIGEHYHELPFDIRLDDCRVQHHIGTDAAQNYHSILTISDPAGDEQKMEISVNHIGRYKHYRFYQMGYDPSGGSAIVVTHDPWGIGFAYAGFALFILAFAAKIISAKSHFNQLLKKLAIAALLLIPTTHSMAAPPTLSETQSHQLGQIWVNYHDRICPLQTLAYDVTYQLYGKHAYDGLTPEQVLSGWIFFPNEWISAPTKGGKHLADQQALQQTLMEGRIFKLFPLADNDQQVSWYAPSDRLPLDADPNEELFVRHFLGYCQEMILLEQYDKIDTLIAKLSKFQNHTAEGQLPSALRTRAERGWNLLANIKPIAMAVTTLGIIAFVIFLIYLGRGKSLPRWVVSVSTWLVIMLSIYLLAILSLRWMAQGHIPLSSGFETMLFLSLSLSTAAWILRKSIPLSLAAGLLMSGLALLVAMMSGGDAVMTQLMPVLQSPLLCLHVSIIMLSYMLLSFVFLISVAALASPHHIQIRLQTMSLLMLYPAVFLLGLGIVIGSIWANISWGCYWSWDPKEVWALITMMIYLVPLHLSADTWIHRPRVYHLYCSLAFLSVIITYFGVNMLLGGMHSYA